MTSHLRKSARRSRPYVLATLALVCLVPTLTTPAPAMGAHLPRPATLCTVVCDGANFSMTYGGGVVATQPRLFFVRFSTSSKGLTPATGFWPGVFAAPSTLAHAVLDSNWTRVWSAEYSVPTKGMIIHPGTFAGVINVNDPTLARFSSLTYVQFADQLSSDVSRGLFSSDPNDIFVLWLRQGQVITLAPGVSTRNAFCAYHQLDINTIPINVAIIPDQQGNRGCDYAPNPANALVDASLLLSHEVAEAVTDPDGLTGWRSTAGIEVSDACGGVNPARQASLGSVAVQYIYSRFIKGCVADLPDTSLSARQVGKSVLVHLTSAGRPVSGAVVDLVGKARVIATAVTSRTGAVTLTLPSSQTTPATLFYSGNAHLAGTSRAFAPVVIVRPSAPTNLTVATHDTTASFFWATPTGSLATRYVVTLSPGGATCVSTVARCSLGGLTLGTTYSATVVAQNSAGTSAPSAPASFSL